MLKVWEVFLVFLRLGLTSFGGPIAHLGYFHDEFVKRKKWIGEHAYADLVGLCQFLPGPASSQVGMAIGLSRAGYLGAVAAWLGFTLPSAVLLVLFALGISKFQVEESWLHGLKVVAVAVVAQALWAMQRKLCPDIYRMAIAVLAALMVFFFPSAVFQILAIGVGGVLGMFFLRQNSVVPEATENIPVSKRTGTVFLIVFVGLLFLFPLLAVQTANPGAVMIDKFYRAGSLVFGGGHVVLPLLRSELVPSGIVSDNMFMAGYGAAQAVPGPLFSFSAYLGAISQSGFGGWWGAAVCLLAVFLPSFLLILGILPFWNSLRRLKEIRYAMTGINAAVVGLLLSAFCNPVWTSAIFGFKDFILAMVCFVLLVFLSAPSWAVVVFGAVAAHYLL
jgi:chromate transporter